MKDQIAYYESKLAFEIDPWDLKVALDAGEKLIVIDARSVTSFLTEHIPGALSIPHREMNPAKTAAMDRTALYVTYCDGIGCNASTKGALAMARLGFRVKELIGGLEWWKRDGFATSTANITGVDCGCG